MSLLNWQWILLDLRFEEWTCGLTKCLHEVGLCFEGIGCKLEKYSRHQQFELGINSGTLLVLQEHVLLVSIDVLEDSVSFHGIHLHKYGQETGKE